MDAAEAAREWIGHDPDARDRTELQALVDLAGAGDPEAAADLADRMSGPLVFGTAGLRGAVGAGMHRMNTAVVTTATAGLAAVLREHVGDDFHVVIGYDGRHRSDEFARAAAGVVVAAGGRASLLPERAPTPVLCFAVNHLGADAGVMVTASHNPPADNGYKVYLGGRMTGPDARGAQIVPPIDGHIMAAIEAAGAPDTVPVADGGWQVLTDEVMDAYAGAAAALRAQLGVLHPFEARGMGELRVVLTAMHGVGAKMASRVLAEAGVHDLHLVPEQAAPDPDFPTVAFPNPEEPGALDLAKQLARSVDADLVVALDPDADRCSLAVPDADADGGWRQLTGDEIGAVLGDYLARAHAGDPDAVLARSIVSSSLLGRIAAAHGVGSAQTLTGFKWIARVPGLVYGYEEAIGYCVNPLVVRDKDGVTAGLVACMIAADAKHRGQSLLDILDDLAVAHGVYATSPLTFRVRDLSLIARGLERLGADPPTQLAGSQVVEFLDLADGYLGLPPTPGYRIETARGDRVVARPSGTEPKLKCYLEVVEPTGSRETVPLARQAAAARLEAIKAELTTVLGFGGEL
ncbi:phospho-sugar mutase [Brooklawnia cerclae]|uniref:Phosphomannomutase n=1 Tax=Brooklawnia cerclae TaxID=349934 RepID=A0ABX0SAM7_9ACTN|nr:phospho-sugar mutase [Brooklawnia cerclae]NIH55389.1 phosphomannomutase [Brooklawnia cerclae]